MPRRGGHPKGWSTSRNSRRRYYAVLAQTWSAIFLAYGDVAPLANACDSPIFLIKGFDDLREAEAFLLANTRGDLGLHLRPALNGPSSGALSSMPAAHLAHVPRGGSPAVSWEIPEGLTPSDDLALPSSTTRGEPVVSRVLSQPLVIASPTSLVREALSIPLPDDSAPSPALCLTPSQTPSVTSRGLNLPGSPRALLSQLETLTLTFKVPSS